MARIARYSSRRAQSGRKAVRAIVYTYTALFEPAAEGGYTVTVPMLPGVITEGDSLEEARDRVREAIRGYLKVLRKHGEPIPRAQKGRSLRPITARVAVSL